MASLRDLQIAMRDHALDRGDAATATAAASILDVHPIPPVERLGIHRNATLLGLNAAMAALFPVTLRLVGEDFFNHMARAFLKSRPTRDPVLYRLGFSFPNFIEHFEAAKSLPYLADVARLEAAWTHAYHGEDATPMLPDRLQEFPQERLGELFLTPLPSIRFVASPYPVVEIWRANQSDEDDAPAISLDDGDTTAIVYRPETEVLILPLSRGAFSFLMALSAGQNLADALNSAMETDPAFAFVEDLRSLLIAGCFKEARLP